MFVPCPFPSPREAGARGGIRAPLPDALRGRGGGGGLWVAPRHLRRGRPCVAQAGGVRRRSERRPSTSLCAVSLLYTAAPWGVRLAFGVAAYPRWAWATLASRRTRPRLGRRARRVQRTAAARLRWAGAAAPQTTRQHRARRQARRRRALLLLRLPPRRRDPRRRRRRRASSGHAQHTSPPRRRMVLASLQHRPHHQSRRDPRSGA